MKKTKINLRFINTLVDEANKSQNISDSGTKIQDTNLGIEWKSQKTLISLKDKVPTVQNIQNSEIKAVVPEKEDIRMKEKDELFKNYDSEFQKNAKTIMQKVIESKMIPKTRIWAVLFLIFFTFLVVAWFFVFDPSHHNLEIYKANIVSILWTNKKNDLTIENSWSIDNYVNEKIQTWSLDNSWASLDVIANEKFNSLWLQAIIFEWWIKKYIYGLDFYTEEELKQKLKEDLQNTSSLTWSLDLNDSTISWDLDLSNETWSIDNLYNSWITEKINEENLLTWSIDLNSGILEENLENKSQTWSIENLSSSWETEKTNEEIYDELLNDPIYYNSWS